MQLTPLLQGHRVIAVYDSILEPGRGGQLRSLPLLCALGVRHFTYNYAWNPYHYGFCDYQYIHLTSSSDFSDIQPPLCQIIDQHTEDASLHDITLRLLANEVFTPSHPFILVTQSNFKLRGVIEPKSLAEARGFPVLKYDKDLLRHPDLLSSLGVNTEAFTHDLLQATGNYTLLEAASMLYELTGTRVKSVIELMPMEPALVQQIGLWHLVEQIDESFLANPTTTKSYVMDCLRPWLEYGCRTQVKNRLLELFQLRRAVWHANAEPSQ